MRGYGQFCPVAKGAEVFAERWTPLVLRELLCGSTHFNDLRRGVPLMSRTLLSLRLKQLEEIGVVKRMSGPKRTFLEIVNRVIVLLVGLAMVVFGFQNFLHDMGSFRAPSLIPLATYTASGPIAGALIVLFSVEQIVNGWRHGFEGPEDADDFAGIMK